MVSAMVGSAVLTEEQGGEAVASKQKQKPETRRISGSLRATTMRQGRLLIDGHCWLAAVAAAMTTTAAAEDVCFVILLIASIRIAHREFWVAHTGQGALRRVPVQRLTHLVSRVRPHGMYDRIYQIRAITKAVIRMV